MPLPSSYERHLSDEGKTFGRSKDLLSFDLHSNLSSGRRRALIGKAQEVEWYGVLLLKFVLDILQRPSDRWMQWAPPSWQANGPGRPILAPN